MATSKHIHKLKKHTYSKSGISIFFCTLPDCHFKVESPLALGKESICNICSNPFIMNERAIKLSRPHCNNCGRRVIKSDDGKRHYIRMHGGRILDAVATEEVADLRSRLDNLITTDDDI